MNSLLKDGLISREIQFSAHDICEELRFARSVSGSTSGSTLASVNSVCDNNLLKRPGSGKKSRKGGNDPGFVILNRSHEVLSCWSFPPFGKESQDRQHAKEVAMLSETNLEALQYKQMNKAGIADQYRRVLSKGVRGHIVCNSCPIMSRSIGDAVSHCSKVGLP